MKIVLLPSIQHTGTVFLQMIVAHSGEKTLNVQLGVRRPPVVSSVKLAATDRGKDVVYVDTVEKLIDTVKNGQLFSPVRVWGPGKNVGVIRTHFGEPERSFLSHEQTEKFIRAFPSVTPVRDPLLSLITRRIRDPQGCGAVFNYLVNGFVFLAELWGRRPENYSLLPVDLYEKKAPSDRFDKLVEIFRSLGLYQLDINEYLKNWSLKWGVVNTVHEDAEVADKGRARTIKDYYYNGEVDKIIEEIPEGWLYLKSKEAQLRPFLEERGYTNLLWWS